MRILPGVLLAAALAVPALGQEEAGPDAFGEAIDVRLVNVEAVVTGRGGQRVRGLSARDFRLLVDGQEVPIDHFTEVVEGEMASFPTEPGEPAAALSSAPGGKVGTSYLVFIDESFAIGAHRDMVLSRLAKDLGRLGPEDRMAVVAFDGRRIDRLSDWTGDQGALVGIFEDARRRPAWGIHRLAMRRSESWGDFSLYPQLESAVAAASAAMRGVTVPSGRKVFLLLSGGWPMISGDNLFGDPLREIRNPFYTPRDEELFEPIADTANLLGYTIYPVDVQGIDPQSNPADASKGPLPQVVSATPAIEGASGVVAFPTQRPNVTLSGFVTSDWERGVHDTLNFLAEETGGKPALNSARLSAFERAVEDTRSYYWLGFTPQWKADGKRHDIRVEVRRPGLSVRSRDGYMDASASTRVALGTESLLLFGGDAGARRLRVEAGEPRRAGLSTIEVPVTIEIPAGALTAMPGNGGSEARAIFSTASLDRYGGRSEVQITELRFPVDGADAGKPLRHQTTLRLRKRAQHLVFAVSDPLGGEQLWAELEVAP